MHICIIGAGVIGLTSAYFLQSEGHSVTIVDREAAAGQGASAANGAQLSYAFVAPLADASVPPRLPALFLTRDSPLKLHFRFDLCSGVGFRFLRHANTADARKTTAGLLKACRVVPRIHRAADRSEGSIVTSRAAASSLFIRTHARSLHRHAQVLYQAGLGSKQTMMTRAQCVNKSRRSSLIKQSRWCLDSR